MIPHKKAQAALEFLMTYGWALIAVLAAIGAFTYLGVLSPDKLIPESCTISPGFECTDFILRSVTGEITGTLPGSELEMSIKNNLGSTVFMNSLYIYVEKASPQQTFPVGDNCGRYTPGPNQNGGTPGTNIFLNVTVPPGEFAYVSCSPATSEILKLTEGELYTVDFEFEYEVTGKRYTKKAEGRLVARAVDRS